MRETVHCSSTCSNTSFTRSASIRTEVPITSGGTARAFIFSMASTSTSEVSHPVVFTTQTSYPLPTQKYMIPASWRRYQLSQLVNKALSLSKPVPFDFLIRGEILRTTLGEWCTERGVGEVRQRDVIRLSLLSSARRICRRKLWK